MSVMARDRSHGGKGRDRKLEGHKAGNQPSSNGGDKLVGRTAISEEAKK